MFNFDKLILPLATAIGAFGGFPDPPKIFEDLIKFEIIKWFLVFVLIYQGGGGADIEFSFFVTIIVYVIYLFLVNIT